MRHCFKIGDRFHIYVGTTGMMNIHTGRNIHEGHKIIIGDITFIVEKVKSDQPSSYYPSLQYYELKIKNQ